MYILKILKIYLFYIFISQYLFRKNIIINIIINIKVNGIINYVKKPHKKYRINRCYN